MRLPHNGAMRRRLALLAFGAIVAASAPALADVTEAAKAEAARAFDEGRKLRDQRDFDKAASAFDRSVKAEPSIGGFYNLAFAYEQLGRTRPALDAYLEALKLAVKNGDAREKETNEAIKKLLATHNYVTVVFQNESDIVAGLRVVVDGEVVPDEQLKGEIFRPKTTHEVVVSAPGRKDRRYLGVQNRAEVRIALGEPAPTGAGAVSPPPPPPPPPSSGGGWGWQKWTGVGMIGGGVVSLAVASILYFPNMTKQLSLNSEADDKCSGGKCPNDTPTRQFVTRNNDNIRDLKDKTPAIIVTGAIGALLVGGGIYVFATAPSGSAEQPPPTPNALRVRVVPQVGVRDSSLTFVGSF
jgi:hypothetical protein